jgi:hypothetical protein
LGTKDFWEYADKVEIGVNTIFHARSGSISLGEKS